MDSSGHWHGRATLGWYLNDPRIYPSTPGISEHAWGISLTAWRLMLWAICAWVYLLRFRFPSGQGRLAMQKNSKTHFSSYVFPNCQAWGPKQNQPPENRKAKGKLKHYLLYYSGGKAQASGQFHPCSKTGCTAVLNVKANGQTVTGHVLIPTALIHHSAGMSWIEHIGQFGWVVKVVISNTLDMRAHQSFVIWMTNQSFVITIIWGYISSTFFALGGCVLSGIASNTSNRAHVFTSLRQSSPPCQLSCDNVSSYTRLSTPCLPVCGVLH